jgi:NAD kinase
MNEKNILIVEKYTAYEYTKLNGRENKIKKERLDELKKAHNEHLNIKNKVLNFLKNKNITHKIIKDDEASNIKYNKFTHVISMGGDGTALHASAYIKKQLFMSINTNKNKSVGFLTRICDDNLIEALERLEKNQLNIHKWDRIYAKINNKLCRTLALNEILVAEKKINKTTHIEINIENKLLNTMSNGIVIATNKGSHAFFKSAGGTPFDVKAIAYVLVLPYSMEGELLKSHILKINTKIKLKPKREHIYLYFDSQDNRKYKLHQGDELEIGIDEKNPLRVLYLD